MDLIPIEMIEKFVSAKDLMTVTVIWIFVRGKVAAHFSAIETSLATISKNIQHLNDSILHVEQSQTSKINALTFRVGEIERLQAGNKS